MVSKDADKHITCVRCGRIVNDGNYVNLYNMGIILCLKCNAIHALESDIAKMDMPKPKDIRNRTMQCNHCGTRKGTYYYKAFWLIRVYCEPCFKKGLKNSYKMKIGGLQ